MFPGQNKAVFQPQRYLSVFLALYDNFKSFTIVVPWIFQNTLLFLNFELAPTWTISGLFHSVLTIPLIRMATSKDDE